MQETGFIGRSQSSPKGVLRPLLAAAINCFSLHARRSLTAAAALCAEKDVLNTTWTSSRTQLSIAGSLNFFPFPSTRGRTPDIFPASSHPPRNLLETSLRRDLPASRLVSPKRWFCSPHQRAPSTPRPPPPSCVRLGQKP